MKYLGKKPPKKETDANFSMAYKCSAWHIIAVHFRQSLIEAAEELEKNCMCSHYYNRPCNCGRGDLARKLRRSAGEEVKK